MAVEDIARTIWWDEDQRKVMLIDQSRLPLVGDLLVCNTADGVCLAITGMAVRGAPALGVAAALAIALWAANEAGEITGIDEFLAELDAVAAKVTATRPTAVNLFWGAERMRTLARANANSPLPELRELLVAEAVSMEGEDEDRNRPIGAYL